MEKYLYFNGVKFTRDDKTGYYLNSTIRKRIHRYVWEYYNGEIPKGYQVHHIDGDKSNNDISNLEILQRSEHAHIHSTEKATRYRKQILENLDNNARPAAIQWHKSEKGSEWHKKHYEQTKHILHNKKEFVCLQCANKFVGIDNGNNKFCSNRCKSKYRRDNSFDNEERICEFCGKQFTTNKYSKTKCCSRSCSNRNRVCKNKID